MVQEAFRLIETIINDEETQLGMLPPPLSEILRKAPAYDCRPDGTGPFGTVETNPIPVNGPIGELSYLSRLQTAKGDRVLFHRIGAIGTVDVFEAVTFSGSEWFTFCLDLYHPRRSRIAPDGFTFTAEVPQFSGFTVFCPNFPYDFVEMKTKDQSDLSIAYIPISRVMPEIRRHAYSRPPSHNARLDRVTAKLTSRG